MATKSVEDSQSTQQKTKQVNVTALTLHQKHMIFVSCFAEGGFVGFDKRKVGNQIYFVFIYKN
jgi:hypothetical protein